MKKDTTIISYSDYRQQDSPPLSLVSAHSVAVVEKEFNERSDPRVGIELELTQRIPILFGHWKKSLLFTLKRRSLYIKKNFLNDFFRGSAFKYPFNVCMKPTQQTNTHRSFY